MAALRSRLAALTAAIALATASSCAQRNVEPALPRPVVVIGVDGLEWRLVEKLSAGGRLPELTRLASDGFAARLSTLAPTISPRIWTSMATGVTPAAHGIRGFVHTGPGGARGEPVLFTNRDRRVKALWNIAGDAGLETCTIGWWMTFPVEDVRGVMVAQTGAPPGSAGVPRKGGLQPGRSGQVFPPSMEGRVFDLAQQSAAESAARERELVGDTSAWPASMKRIVEHSRWSLDADTAYQRIALELAAEPRRCEVLMVYLGLPDVLGHRFWRWAWPDDFAPAPSPDEAAAYGDVLAKAYAQVDAFVGAMRRSAGEGAALLVVSDHGMGGFRPGAAVDLDHDDGRLLRTGGHSSRRDAFVAGAGPGLRRRGRGLDRLTTRGSVLDLTPTLLALLGLPVGADMDGRPLEAALDPAFLAAHPVKEVATHTPPGWAASRRLADAEDPAGGERIEQLRGLGYLH